MAEKSVTTAGLIYDEVTGELLRIVIPDDDASLTLHIGTGEALARVGLPAYVAATPQQLSDVFESISRIPQPPIKRLAVVDSKGVVLQVVHTVKDRYTAPAGTTAVESSKAELGGTIVNGVYTPPTVVKVGPTKGTTEKPAGTITVKGKGH